MYCLYKNTSQSCKSATTSYYKINLFTMQTTNSLTYRIPQYFIKILTYQARVDLFPLQSHLIAKALTLKTASKLDHTKCGPNFAYVAPLRLPH